MAKPSNSQSSKIVPILTGAISLILGLAYLALVQFLDFRGEMLPAPPLSSVYGFVREML